tara:strand:+ start:12526 stop:13110 length:585 start_codon:yes stop_codon:yes gene_type:complete
MSVFKSWQVILELIHDRGYTYEAAYSKLTKSDIQVMASTNNLNLIGKRGVNEVVYVSYLLDEKVRLQYAKDLIETIYASSDTLRIRIILVFNMKPNPSIKKLEKLYNIQVFWKTELQINPTKHMLVPQHTLIKKEDQRAIMANYNILLKSQLPAIKENDIICRYYNFKKGDIIKIKGTCRNKDADIYKYRYVAG